MEEAKVNLNTDSSALIVSYFCRGFKKKTAALATTNDKIYVSKLCKRVTTPFERRLNRGEDVGTN